MDRHRSFHGVVRASTLLVALVASAGHARATDWYVDQAWTSCASSDGSQGNPWCTIGAAIAAAASGDTIHIAPGTYVEQLLVAKDLSFIGTSGGAVTTIDGGKAFRVMTLAAGTVVDVAGLTIQRGKDPTSVRCGGVYVDHATLTITDCVLSANEIAIQVSDGTLTMSGCLVTGNDAKSGVGAGICAFNPASSLTVTDSRFTFNQAQSGGAIWSGQGAVATIERCTFRANRARPRLMVEGSGGALAGDALNVVDCLFDANVAEGWTNGTGGHGGAALVWGLPRFERCRFVANVADSALGQSLGGGVFVAYDSRFGGGLATFVDCELVDNVCGSSIDGEGGFGGAVHLGPSAGATFERCTLAGNRADGTGSVTFGGTGGGIWAHASAGTTHLAHTIVAGNFAADPNGAPDATGPSITTLDWNVIGDTSDLTLLGSGPNDLLDVDPQFVDPANGDYSLQPISPAVESGDPAIPLGGKDVAQAPRLLDGDLDRALRIDRGAREFGHVQLAVSGVFAPGGTITVDTTGSAGLPVLLIVGEGASELALRPYGSLFVDLALWNSILPWGVIPSSTPITIDPLLPVPLDLHVQALATSGRTGNLSNLVSFTID